MRRPPGGTAGRTAPQQGRSWWWGEAGGGRGGSRHVRRAGGRKWVGWHWRLAVRVGGRVRAREGRQGPQVGGLALRQDHGALHTPHAPLERQAPVLQPGRQLPGRQQVLQQAQRPRDDAVEVALARDHELHSTAASTVVMLVQCTAPCHRQTPGRRAAATSTATAAAARDGPGCRKPRCRSCRTHIESGGLFHRGQIAVYERDLDRNLQRRMKIVAAPHTWTQVGTWQCPTLTAAFQHSSARSSWPSSRIPIASPSRYLVQLQCKIMTPEGWRRGAPPSLQPAEHAAVPQHLLSPLFCCHQVALLICLCRSPFICPDWPPYRP